MISLVLVLICSMLLENLLVVGERHVRSTNRHREHQHVVQMRQTGQRVQNVFTILK